MTSLTIVGTNHVAKASQDKITDAFARHDPDVVAIELDHDRYTSLRSNDRTAPSLRIAHHVGLTAYLFARFAYHAQHIISRRTGVLPGEEMLHAADLAAKHERPVHFIDQPFQQTLQNVNDAFGFKEACKLVSDLVTAPFTTNAPALDPNTVPDDETTRRITRYIETRYPPLYKAVISDRDEHMAAEIQRLVDDENTVLAVMGAAHKHGVEQRLNHD